MTKTDIAVLIGVATMANEKGLIPLEAFQAVGRAVSKARSALEIMGDNDVMVIKKGPSPEAIPDESASPEKIDVTSVDKEGHGTDFETTE